MVIKLSIDVGLHDVYSAIDVDFARECEKTDRRHSRSEFGPRVTKSPNGFSPLSRIWTLPYYNCMITPRINVFRRIVYHPRLKRVNLKAV